MQQLQQQQQQQERQRRNVAIGAIALLVSWTVVATFCVCLYLLVRPTPPTAYDSLLRSHMVTLNQTLWSLAAQTELTNGELSDVANAFVGLADLIQTNDALLFNSTERTRAGLIMLLKYLQQKAGSA